MNKRIIISLFLCLSSFAALGQTDVALSDEGSVYSRFGIGYPLDITSSSADGLGLSGVSFIESGVPSTANPALWGSTVFGMATGGVGIDNFNAEDNAGSARNSLVSINQFQLQLPIYKNKFGISASFSPYSRTAFQGLESGTRVVGSGATQDTLNFRTQNTGSGGVNRFELGVGWKINNWLSVGYAPSFVFASIDNEFNTRFFQDENNTVPVPFATLQPVDFTQQTSALGFGNRAGVYLTLPSVALENDQLNIGATVDFPVVLNGERVQEDFFASDDDDEFDIDAENQVAEGSIRLPLGVTTGITYQPYDKMAFTTEALYQKWSDFENELNTTAGNIFTDRFKIGAGFRYLPFVTGSDKFLSRFKYRIGASYDTGHLELNGENINTLLFSAGIGLLSPNSNSSIDVSFEYGIRGTKSANLVKENIWGVNLSVNLAEIFFFRPKLQ